MSDWGVTQRVASRVQLADGVVLEGDLHLQARTSYPPGPETALEMLNRPDEFFALSLPDGAVALLSKGQVVLVSCREHAPLADPDRVSAARLVVLDVVLNGGARYHGRAAFELPPSRARALDYVNGSGRFFALWQDAVTHYLNKAFVRLIRPLD